MRAPTKKEMDELYWMPFVEFFYYEDEETDIITFRKGTPKKVIESYLLTHDESTMKVED